MAQNPARKGARVRGAGDASSRRQDLRVGGRRTWTPPPPAGGRQQGPRGGRARAPRSQPQSRVLCRAWTGVGPSQTSRNCRGSRPPQSSRAPGPRPADSSLGRSSPREGGSPGTGPLTSLSFSPPPKPRPREELVGGRSGGDSLAGRVQRTSPLRSAGGRRGAAPRVPVGLREPVAAGGS